MHFAIASTTVALLLALSVAALPIQPCSDISETDQKLVIAAHILPPDDASQKTIIVSTGPPQEAVIVPTVPLQGWVPQSGGAHARPFTS